jgi:hypothetical protein
MEHVKLFARQAKAINKLSCADCHFIDSYYWHNGMEHVKLFARQAKTINKLSCADCHFIDSYYWHNGMEHVKLFARQAKAINKFSCADCHFIDSYYWHNWMEHVKFCDLQSTSIPSFTAASIFVNVTLATGTSVCNKLAEKHYRFCALIFVVCLDPEIGGITFILNIMMNVGSDTT